MSTHPNFPNFPKSVKSGWPWDSQIKSDMIYSQKDSRWPKISIVTPSYNQARYLEETIRSVLLQGYPNLEYIIIDGGSTDRSVEIIKQYEPWLYYWKSEKDDGQSSAINKGFEKATGDIYAWINSDDFYAPQALFRVASTFLHNKTLWVAGITHKVNSTGDVIQFGNKFGEHIESWYVGSPYLQPSIFWHRELWEKVGKLDENLHYSFDYDLLMRFIQHQSFATWIEYHIANFRIHSESKTSTSQLKFMDERNSIYNRYPIKVKGIPENFYIWKMRRERRSRVFMGLLGSLPFGKIILYIFLETPWFFLKINFLYWIKKKLQG